MIARLLAGRARRVGALLRRLRGCIAGTSAVEFAVLAPVLVVGAFSTADIGMAIHERMMIGQTLRAGAVPAMAGASHAEVMRVVEAVAADNFTLSRNGIYVPGMLLPGIEDYWACPDADFKHVQRTDTCASGEPPQHYYRLTATKSFRGVILPQFPISGAVEVLAR